MLGDLSKEVVAGARVAEIVQHVGAVEGERRLSPRNLVGADRTQRTHRAHRVAEEGTIGEVDDEAREIDATAVRLRVWAEDDGWQPAAITV